MAEIMKAPTTTSFAQNELPSLKEDAAPIEKVNMTQTGPSTAAKSADNLGSMDAATGTMGEASDASFQANKIMGQDSPLMVQARNDGMLAAGKRGLTNSSIAAGAAQGAATRAAVPLAQQNAAANQKQDLTNQANEQQAEQINTDAENKSAMLDATEQNKMQGQFDDNQFKADVTDATEQNKAAMQKYSADAELNRTWLSGDISKTMAHIQGQYQQLIAVNQSAAAMYGSTLDGLADMWANSEVPMKQKNAYTTSVMNFLQNGLKVTASIADMEFKTSTVSR
jgi:hypothetical protein